MRGKILTGPLKMTTDTGTAGKIDTTGDIAVANVDDLTNVSIFVNQETDAGTCSLVVEETVDGTNWAVVATIVDTDFPAGNNKSLKKTLSDSSGMHTRSRQVRVRAGAIAGGGIYSASYSGAAAT